MPFLHGTLRHVRANAIAYLALFIALGGTSAYAANTVFSADIVDGEVKSADLGLDSVTSNRIKAGNIINSDLAPDAVTTGKIKAGNVGTTDLADGAVTTDKLGPVPAVEVLNFSTESIGAGGSYPLHADFEMYDTADLHDTATNNENFVAPVSGSYVVSATVDWDPNETGPRRTTIQGPSGTVASVAGPPLATPFYTSQNVSGVARLTAGQSLNVLANQSSGGNLGVRISRFQMTFVGK
jgi:hypothetical protein